MMKFRTIHLIKIVFFSLTVILLAEARASSNPNEELSPRQGALIQIAALTAKGELEQLKPAINQALQNGVSVNEIKESMVHLYAYAGFPRSIRGLQTLMSVIEDRKTRGIQDNWGPKASPILDKRSKYERGKEVLEKLTGVAQSSSPSGYAAFAPEIEIFLKEHLFADIFERDILSYKDRELVTVAVLSSIGGLEPMLNSHFGICLNIGLRPVQLKQMITIISTSIGEKEAQSAQVVLAKLLKEETAAKVTLIGGNGLIFPQGEKNTNDNFYGEVWVKSLIEADSLNENAVGNVTFAPGARSKWHVHPSGQILLVTAGIGYYQEKGKPKKVLQKGDVVKCPPNVSHWHGASADHSFVQLAITGRQNGPTLWQQAVTDEEYHATVQ